MTTDEYRIKTWKDAEMWKRVHPNAVYWFSLPKPDWEFIEKMVAMRVEETAKKIQARLDATPEQKIVQQRLMNLEVIKERIESDDKSKWLPYMTQKKLCKQCIYRETRISKSRDKPYDFCKAYDCPAFKCAHVCQDKQLIKIEARL